MYKITKKPNGCSERVIATGETLEEVVSNWLNTLEVIDFDPYDENGNWDGNDAEEVFLRNRDRFYEFLYKDDERIL